MSEKLAVVGSREGADLEAVRNFVLELHRQAPETVIVSGGAGGVDSTAETTWRSLGGHAISFRAKRFPDFRGQEEFGVECWDLGENPKVYDLIHAPTFADYVSTLIYRDMLIAQECTRLVAFTRRGGSRGTAMTCQFAQNEGKPTFIFGGDAS